MSYSFKQCKNILENKVGIPKKKIKKYCKKYGKEKKTLEKLLYKKTGCKTFKEYNKKYKKENSIEKQKEDNNESKTMSTMTTIAVDEDGNVTETVSEFETAFLDGDDSIICINDESETNDVVEKVFEMSDGQMSFSFNDFVLEEKTTNEEKIELPYITDDDNDNTDINDIDRDNETTNAANAGSILDEHLEEIKGIPQHDVNDIHDDTCKDEDKPADIKSTDEPDEHVINSADDGVANTSFDSSVPLVSITQIEESSTHAITMDQDNDNRWENISPGYIKNYDKAFDISDDNNNTNEKKGNIMPDSTLNNSNDVSYENDNDDDNNNDMKHNAENDEQSNNSQEETLKTDDIFSGIKTMTFDNIAVSTFGNGESVSLDKEEFNNGGAKWNVNDIKDTTKENDDNKDI